jgi:hypothetical protein
MDDNLKLGLQLPESVNGGPNKETVYPEDSNEAVVSKCMAAIAQETKRVLFGLFEDVDVKVRSFQIDPAGYSQEGVAALKADFRTALQDLKTAMFHADVDVNETDDGYDVESVISGENIQQVKKLLGVLRVCSNVDKLRAGMKFDISKLMTVIDRSQKIIDEKPEDDEITAREKKRVEDAEATIADRNPKLEQKNLAYTEITTFFDRFLKLSSIDPNELWKSATDLVERLETQNYLNEAEKAKLIDIKQICNELKAECQVPKGENPAVVEATKKRHNRIGKIIINIVFGIIFLQGIFASAALYLKYTSDKKPKTPVMQKVPKNSLDWNAIRGHKSQTDLLLENMKKQIQKEKKSLHLKNVPNNATPEQYKKIMAENIKMVILKYLKVPLSTPQIDKEALEGKKPVLNLSGDKINGGTPIIKVWILKYEQKDLKGANVSKATNEQQGFDDLHLVEAERRIKYRIDFEGSVQGSETVTEEAKIKYVDKKPRDWKK